MMTPTIQRVW